MSWAWPSRRSSTEKLSNQVMMPWSFTPLTRNMVTGVLVRRRVFRNMSWRLLTLSAICSSPGSGPNGIASLNITHGGAMRIHGGRAAAPDGERSAPRLAPVPARVAEAQRLQFAMQRRTLHADEVGGARNVARKTANLDAQIFALERLPRLAKRRSHDRLHRFARGQ